MVYREYFSCSAMGSVKNTKAWNPIKRIIFIVLWFFTREEPFFHIIFFDVQPNVVTG